MAKLSEAERERVIALIQEGKPLPVKYQQFSFWATEHLTEGEDEGGKATEGIFRRADRAVSRLHCRFWTGGLA